PEHHLDFSEIVQELRADVRALRRPGAARLVVTLLLTSMGQPREPGRGERVEDRHQKDQRGNGVEGLDLNPRRKTVREGAPGIRGIAGEGAAELAPRAFVVHPRTLANAWRQSKRPTGFVPRILTRVHRHRA